MRQCICCFVLLFVSFHRARGFASSGSRIDNNFFYLDGRNGDIAAGRQAPRSLQIRDGSCSVLKMSSDGNNHHSQHQSPSFSDISKNFCKLSPLWTILSATIAMNYPSFIGSTIGSFSIMQTAFGVLMLAMGLTITPMDISRALQKPDIIMLNILLCFGMMPLLAMLIGTALRLGSDYNAGLILLGCVSGGQASNLFALLAGGDVALSVSCTLSTTLLGIIAIPVLVEKMLSTVVVVDSIGVLKSVAQLVLCPLVLGLSLGKVIKPSLVQRLQSVCPLVGVLATLVLVAGGASNFAFISNGIGKSDLCSILLAAYLLPILGGAFAWIFSFLKSNDRGMNEPSRRTLVVETLSKTPTLAYVLAKKHFSELSAAIPAAAMVSLAIVGAMVATLWSMIDPIEKYHKCA